MQQMKKPSQICDGFFLCGVIIGKNIPDDMKDKIWTNAFTTSPESKNNTGLELFIVKEIFLIEHTDCGFENLKNGVRFWFDFINYE